MGEAQSAESEKSAIAKLERKRNRIGGHWLRRRI
jgi:hypothetical protein